MAAYRHHPRVGVVPDLRRQLMVDSHDGYELGGTLRLPRLLRVPKKILVENPRLSHQKTGSINLIKTHLLVLQPDVHLLFDILPTVYHHLLFRHLLAGLHNNEPVLNLCFDFVFIQERFS